MKCLFAWLLCLVLMMGMCAFAEEGWENILLLGNDTRNFPQFERSDAIIIISINDELGKIKLTSILRDTDVAYAGGSSGKINGAMAKGGPENAVKTVNQNFGLDISEYIVIDFRQMVQAINLIGGVDIEIDKSELRELPVHYSGFGVETEYTIPENAGDVHLTGGLALSYSRNRASAGGDFDRVKRQQKMLAALLTELQEKPIDEAIDLADELMALVSTNMSNERLLELGKFALTVEVDTIEGFRLPVDGSYQSGTFNGTWKIKPNLEKNRIQLQDFIYGAELRKGSSGETVRKLQQKLVEMGFLNDKVDGVFGNKTEEALMAAQEHLGTEVTGRASEDFLEMLYGQ